jgi:hypothetical protein
VHDYFAVAEVEMHYRAYVESYKRAHHAENDSGHLAFIFPPRSDERSPRLDEKDGHERKIKRQRGQAPPGGYLNRSGMKMTGRQSALVIESELVFEFGLAPLAYAKHRVGPDERQSLAPHFQAISGAALMKLEYRASARAFERDHSYGRKKDYHEHRRHNRAAA